MLVSNDSELSIRREMAKQIFFYKNLDHYQKSASNTYSLKMSSSAKNIGFRREIRFYRLFFSVLGVDTFNSDNFYSQNGTFPSPPPFNTNSKSLVFRTNMTDTEEYSGFRVVEKLECQIQAMEAELADLQLNISIR